ncbi:MAG: type II secretion system F family protein, partial [Actinomycetota bacterium]|nr:type II secretion system F family protein [Actinomycetota bacterium]
MRWGVAGAVCVAVLGPLVPAYAAGNGSIDYVETTKDGDVRLLFSVDGLPAGVAPDLDSVEVSVDGQPVDATAAPAEAGSIARTTVLALDVSNSMAGAKFTAAKEAAAAFIDTAPEDLSIGLVTFAGEVTTVQTPTTDHGSVEGAIATLSLSRSTELYDGVLQAVDVAGDEGSRSVLVLSDGADTSRTPVSEVVDTAAAAGVHVDVVALGRSTAHHSALESIADAAGGTVVAADRAASLESFFMAQADALAQQLLVEFTVDEGAAGEASVEASVTARGQRYTDSAFVQLEVASTSSAPVGPQQVERSAPAFAADERVLYGGAAALGLGLAVVLALVFLGRPQQKQTFAERQLAHYSTGRPSSAGPAPRVAMTATPVNVRGSAVAVAGRIVGKGDVEARLTKRLMGAGISMTAAEWLLLHAGVAVAAGLLGLVLGGALLMVFALFLGAVGPWLFLSLKRTRRVKAFNAQMADTLQVMSGGLSAGLSLPQAVDTVVREGSEPMAGELKRALIEQRLGVDIEDALDGVADRMESRDFRWIVMAIRIQREVGGNLAELLLTVAATLREREYLRRQVLTLSAEGRLSAWILGGLPPAFVAYLALARPDYLRPMLT